MQEAEDCESIKNDVSVSSAGKQEFAHGRPVTQLGQNAYLQDGPRSSILQTSACLSENALAVNEVFEDALALLYGNRLPRAADYPQIPTP